MKLNGVRATLPGVKGDQEEEMLPQTRSRFKAKKLLVDR